MNFSPLAERAIKSVQSATIAERLHTASKVLYDCERQPKEVTRTLAAALRKLLTPIITDETATAEQILHVRDMLARTGKIDPRRKGKRVATVEALVGTDRTPQQRTADGDEWDAPSLSTDESLRIARITGDSKSMLTAALDGREPTIPNLKKLHHHMEAAPIAIASGPLFAEIERILRERGALPTPEPGVSTYAERLIAELRSRD